MQAIILAAGRGYRLNQLTKNNTKCMIEINGVSLIERMLRQLVKFGVNDIIIVNGYQKDILEQFVSSLNLEASIKYITNEKSLGDRISISELINQINSIDNVLYVDLNNTNIGIIDDDYNYTSINDYIINDNRYYNLVNLNIYISTI